MFSTLAGVFVAFAGLIVSGALTVQHLDPATRQRLCAAGDACQQVLNSRFAMIGPVPVAAVGLGAYAILLLMLTSSLSLPDGRWRRGLLACSRVVATAGAVASAGLMGVQLFVIRGFCPLCTLSAVFMVVLAVATWTVRREPAWPARPLATTGLALLMLATLLLLRPLVRVPGERVEVLARVDGRLITVRDMEQESPILAGLARETYEAKRDWAEQKIEELLIETEAKKRGVSPEELLREEVEEKIDAKALDAWLEKQKKEGQQEVNWYSAQAKALAELRAQRRGEWMRELRRGHQAEMLVRRPGGWVLEGDPALTHTAGAEDATIKLVVFSDFQCPYCADLAEVLQRVMDKFPFEVSVAYVPNPMKDHPLALDAAAAAECAGEQGKFWAYHDVLVGMKSNVEGKWEQYAKEAGLDVEQFNACMRAGSGRARVERAKKMAEELGVDSVPALYLNGRRIGGHVPYEDLERLIRVERDRLSVAG